MNKLDQIVDRYYNAVIRYENYLSRKENTKDSSYKRANMIMTNLLDTAYVEDCMPWRLIKPDLREGIKKDFMSLEHKKIIAYLRACDAVSDDLFNSAKTDLINYYLKKGFDVNSEKILSKIEKELETVFENPKLDSKKYSKDTIELFEISNEFDSLSDDVLRIYHKEYTIDEEPEVYNQINIEINNGGTLKISQIDVDKLRNGIAVESIDDKDKVYRRDLISEGDFVMLMNYYRYVVDNDIKNDFINPNGLTDENDQEVDTEYGLG